VTKSELLQKKLVSYSLRKAILKESVFQTLLRADFQPQFHSLTQKDGAWRYSFLIILSDDSRQEVCGSHIQELAGFERQVTISSVIFKLTEC
jgi:hypothetical protein